MQKVANVIGIIGIVLFFLVLTGHVPQTAQASPNAAVEELDYKDHVHYYKLTDRKNSVICYSSIWANGDDHGHGLQCLKIGPTN